jgi:putative transcriptional regulator
MAPAKRNIGQEILDGIRQLKRGEHGRVTNVPSVASIREKTGLSQPRFAELLGVSVRTLQEWEQGRRAPSGAARTLLLIAAKNPHALLDVVMPTPRTRSPFATALAMCSSVRYLILATKRADFRRTL